MHAKHDQRHYQRARIRSFFDLVAKAAPSRPNRKCSAINEIAVADLSMGSRNYCCGVITAPVTAARVSRFFRGDAAVVSAGHALQRFQIREGAVAGLGGGA